MSAKASGSAFSINPRLTCGAKFKDGEGVERACQRSIHAVGLHAAATDGREGPDICAKCGLTWQSHIDNKAGACPFVRWSSGVMP